LKKKENHAGRRVIFLSRISINGKQVVRGEIERQISELQSLLLRLAEVYPETRMKRRTEPG
jgi:hypothetical protein